MSNSHHRISLNQNWNMLQNLLLDKSRPNSRPRSSCMNRRQQSYKRVSKSINVSSISQNNSISPTKPRSTSSMQISRRSHAKVLRSFHQNYHTIQGITQFNLKKIYAAKCKDLNIPKFPDQQKRFFAYCFKYFRDRIFQMRDSGLGVNSAQVLANVLKKNYFFSSIILNRNTLGDQGTFIITKALKQTVSLVHLDLSSNDISPLGAVLLFESLTSHPSLISLDLSSHEGLHRNRIANQGSKALQVFLQNNQMLQILNIEGTAVGPDGLMHLIQGLKKNLNLVSLNIANNALGSTGIPELTRTVSESKLKILNIAQNKLGNDSCVFFASLLKGGYDQIPVLQRLILSKNEISTKGISKIFDGLRGNYNLNDLIVDNNSMPLGLSQIFLQFLLDNHYLRTINLSYCQLKLEGVYILVEGLGKNGGVLVLNLSHNLIDDTGAQAISFGLAKNSALKLLDLSSNRIKNKGGMALAQSLKVNFTLQALLIKDNSLKDQAGQLLCEVSRFNHSLLRLELELNPINIKYINDIQSNLVYNQQIFKKNQVPKLVARIDRLRQSDNSIQQVYQQFQKKKREKFQMQKKFERQVERYQAVKENQEVKLSELQEQLAQLRAKSINLSELLGQFQTQKRMLQFRNDKIVDSLGNDIAKVVYNIKNQEKNKSNLKEKFAMQRIQLEQSVKELEENLRNLVVGEKSAAHSLEIMRQRLLQKQGNYSTVPQIQVSPVANKPKLPSYQQSKSYLASEKLATSKKQARQTPRKESPRPNSGRPKSRTKKRK